MAFAATIPHVHAAPLTHRVKSAPKCVARASRPLPNSGYFSEADPNDEVRPALGGVEKVDVTKRGGRYTSDFIWNTNWQKQMDYEASLREAEARRAQQAEQPAQSGFLSLGRLSELNSMDVDLSEQLRKRATDAAAAPQQPPPQRKLRRNNNFAAVPPSLGEAKRWERSGRYSRRPVMLASDQDLDAERAAEVAAERQRYEQLKVEFQFWTLATTLLCFAATYAFYSKDVSASYLVGAIGGYAYLRLLNQSVDGVAASSMGAVIGQPRLLIPLILVLAFNRWNELKAEEFGVTLQLLPMLAGFFTYKIAIVGRQGVQLLRDITASDTTSNSEPDSGTGSSAVDDAALNVDRAFVNRILTK